MTEPNSPPGASGKCPICSRAADAKFRPFCSRRCADVDLSRWLGGAYAIPDAVASEDGDEGAEAERASPDKRDPGSTH